MNRLGKFALKLREGQYHFDTPSDLIGLLKTMARSVVARVELLERALERLPERDRQILDWRQELITSCRER